MECQNFEQEIQLFIDDQLTGNQLQAFIAHIEVCHNCYEEMEISYLLKEALLRLEDGEAFDLHSELIQKLACMKKCASIHEILSLLRRTILLASGFTIVAEFIYIYLMFF